MAAPLQFGDSKRPLYGVYHAPARGGRKRAVLLCNPFGEEAIRAFRIYRLLAEKLAEAGAAALRFDYAATGDSAGPCEDAQVQGFSDSIVEAAQELLDMSGAQEIALVGLRLGAAAAVLAAPRLSPGPAHLVLWDPIVSGRAYLEELKAGHAHAVKTQTGAAPAESARICEALGFAISPKMVASLATLDLAGGAQKSAQKSAKKVTIIAGPTTDLRLAEALRPGAEIVWREDFGETSWNSDKALNAFVVPARTLTQIVADALA